MSWIVTVTHLHVNGLLPTRDYSFGDEAQARMFLRSCRSDGQPATIRALGNPASEGEE